MTYAMRRCGALAAALCVAFLAGAPSAAAAEPLATCFWEGPISTEQKSTRGFDGRDFNFPEESATYWMARFRMPLGARIVLRGRYAHGRYQSLNAYSDGAPTDALPDFAMQPDAGSVNPFPRGARRDGNARSYTLNVVNESAPAQRQPNTVYARPQQPDDPIELFYRVYEPDRGRDLTGGTGLPDPEVILSDGSRLRGDAACGAVNDPDREIPVQSVPAATWQAAVGSPGCDPNTNPAYNPVRWERFFNLEYATEAVVTDCTAAGRELRRNEPAPEKGGFYSNRDNAYIFSHLSRRFGQLLVLKAKMPTVPRTRQGQRRMGGGQLRFWSLCTGESRVTTRTPDCLADRQLPVNGARDYTVVVSKAADRPANATPRCGVGWLDWGERGDAAGRPDYAALIMRNMLPEASFAQAIQRVPKPGAEQDVMGAYFPQSGYSTKALFEARGCSASRLALRGRRLRADRRGRLRVRLACKSYESSCSGRLGISARGIGRRLGAARFSLRSGTSRLVRVRLARHGRRALRRRGRVRVTVKARGATPAEVALRAKRRYALRARR